MSGSSAFYVTFIWYNSTFSQEICTFKMTKWIKKGNGYLETGSSYLTHNLLDLKRWLDQYVFGPIKNKMCEIPILTFCLCDLSIG